MANEYPDPEEAAYALAYPARRLSNTYLGTPQQPWKDFSIPGDPVLDDDSEPPISSHAGGLDRHGADALRDAKTRLADFAIEDDDIGIDQDQGSYNLRRAKKRVPGRPQDDAVQAARDSRGRGRRGRRGGLGRGGKGIKRGIRAPLEPTEEFKALHSEATMAFIAEDFDGAEDLILQAIQLNPDMHAAHSLLTEIHARRGDADKALAAAWNGAHTRPRDIQLWAKVARIVLERDESRKQPTLRDAIYCYTRILTVDKTHLDARFQRAALNRELGYYRKVAAEYEYLLKLLPHDLTVLRLLAEVCIEINAPGRPLEHYQKAISYLQEGASTDSHELSWSDVNIIAELLGFQKDYSTGIHQIKNLSRWLLGRSEEDFWDSFKADDREYDAEDEPRRMQVAQFQPGQYDDESYGRGLPLELRIKLGSFRLKANPDQLGEALSHFDYLEPTDEEAGAKLFDYPDLFRDAAKSLFEAGYHSEALLFYEPLQQIPDYFDVSCHRELVSCYASLGILERDIGYSAGVADNEESSRAEEIGEENNSVQTPRIDDHSGPALGFGGLLGQQTPASGRKKTSRTNQETPNRRGYRRKNKDAKNIQDFEDIERLYMRRQELAKLLREGVSQSRDSWMLISKKLITIFTSYTEFYPSHKRKSRNHHDISRASRRAIATQEESKGDATDPTSSSGNFGEVSFSAWLDIFLEYGLELARESKYDEAYSTMISAKDATVFEKRRDSMFLIHVCWASCALIASDDEMLCNVSRWFMHDYQFVSDSYRIYSALNRLSDSNHEWFNCNALQKYLLRQVKSLDLSIRRETRQDILYQERASYTNRDAEGRTVFADEIDVSLMMLYGHVLYAGKSYAYAVNYFLRALAIEPDNPIIKMSLALAYINHAFKRQAGNRHLLLMQGFALMHEYHEHRQENATGSEDQEACYNLGRAYHLVGLADLAIPYYEKCLQISEDAQDAEGMGSSETFAQEAALALRGIWAANGNSRRAMEVTEKWLQM